MCVEVSLQPIHVDSMHKGLGLLCDSPEVEVCADMQDVPRPDHCHSEVWDMCYVLAKLHP